MVLLAQVTLHNPAVHELPVGPIVARVQVFLDRYQGLFRRHVLIVAVSIWFLFSRSVSQGQFSLDINSNLPYSQSTSISRGELICRSIGRALFARSFQYCWRLNQ